MKPCSFLFYRFGLVVLCAVWVDVNTTITEIIRRATYIQKAASRCLAVAVQVLLTLGTQVVDHENFDGNISLKIKHQFDPYIQDGACVLRLPIFCCWIAALPPVKVVFRKSSLSMIPMLGSHSRVSSGQTEHCSRSCMIQTSRRRS